MNNYRKQIAQYNADLSKTMGLYGKWAKNHGLNYNSLMVLYAMESKPECTQRYICEQWMLPKQTVNTILTTFKNKGLLELETISDNKREKIIRLTQAGEDYAKGILSQLYTIENRVLEMMGPSRCDALISANTAFRQLFEQEVENDESTV